MGITVMDVKERERLYGIECTNDLSFHGWKPGGEYKSYLVLKNVGKKIQNVKWQLPETKFFEMKFPEWVKLGPGMTYKAEIIFRPIREEEYDDHLLFFVKEQGSNTVNSFYIPICATLERADVRIPQLLDFDHCPANETFTKTFAIVNEGEIPAPYKFRVDSPFALNPSSGVLKAGESHRIAASFTPTDACVVIARALCEVDRDIRGGGTMEMEVRGMGKCPYVTADSTKFDFGEVHTSRSEQRVFFIHNHSQVHATFEIACQSTDVAVPFKFVPPKGVIPANSSSQMTIMYHPTNTDTLSIDEFVLSTPGGNSVTFTCQGLAIGPSVRLSASSLNFDDVRCGAWSRRVLTLYNTSEVPANFMLVLERRGVFRTKIIQGTIGRQSSVHVPIEFHPAREFNYYKRVYILIQNQHPLYCDLIGTCIPTDPDAPRPPQLMKKHIDLYFNRRMYGFHLYPPEKLEALFDDPAKGQQLQEVVQMPPPELTRRALYEDLFSKQSHPSHEIFIEEEVIDFGAGSRRRLNDYKTVHVTNRTKGKIMVSWTNLVNKVNEEHAMDATHDSTAVFSVFPETGDIKPGGTLDFRVNFRPDKDNQYFSVRLECFAEFKAMRNFRLIKDDTVMTPPVALSVLARGHTFPVGSEQFLTKPQWSTRRVDFPAVLPGRAVQQTLALSNNSDTPMMFVFQNDPSEIFDVFPRAGMVEPRETQLLVFSFKPRSGKLYHTTMKCVLNNSEAASTTITLIGLGSIPKLETENDGRLYFKPTFVGAPCTRSSAVKNRSRLDLVYKWVVPDRKKAVFSVEPESGVMKGNELVEFQWKFLPRHKKAYMTRIPCEVYPRILEGEASVPTTRVYLTLLGQGSMGALAIDPQDLDFGTVQACSSVKKVVRLINRSDCLLSYRLQAARVDTSLPEGLSSLPVDMPSARARALALNALKSDDGPEIPPRDGNELLWFDEVEGDLPGRAHKDVTIRFTPSDRRAYGFELCAPFVIEGMVFSSSEPEFCAKCVVSGFGDYPTIQVTDAWVEGVVKSRLWKELQLDTLNKILLSRLSESDQQMNLATSEVGQWHTLVSTLPTVNFRFSPRELHAPPLAICLQVTNTGDLPVKWRIRFPNEAGVDVEPWCDIGEITKEEIHQNFILDNNVISMEPRQGELAPSESAVVVCTFSYCNVGDYEMKTILEVENGRMVVLDLRGHTLSPSSPSLDLYTEQSTAVVALADVVCGDPAPPVQTIEFRNPSVVPFEYILDTSDLARLRMESHGFEVLQCHNGRGRADAGEIVTVDFTFQPMRPQVYSVNLPINVIGSGVLGTIELRARGVPSARCPEALMPAPPLELPPVTFPMRPSLTVMGQLGALSCDRVDFGLMPCMALGRRLVSVTNTSETTISFEWDVLPTPTSTDFSPVTHTQVTSELARSLVSVDPQCGVLKPGRSVLCRVMFHPGNRSRVYDLHVACITMDLDELAQYNAAIKENDDDDLDSPMKRPSTSTRELKTATPRRKTVVSAAPKTRVQKDVSMSFSEKLYKKERDLASGPGRSRGPSRLHGLSPSLMSSTSVGGTSQGSRLSSAASGVFANNEEEGLVEPAPYVMYLSISATTATVETYRRLHEDIQSHFIPQPSLAINFTPHVFDNISGDLVTPCSSQALTGKLSGPLQQPSQIPSVTRTPSQTLSAEPSQITPEQSQISLASAASHSQPNLSNLSLCDSGVLLEGKKAWRQLAHGVGKGFAENFLRTLITELIVDPEIRGFVSQIEPPEVPYFTQFLPDDRLPSARKHASEPARHPGVYSGGVGTLDDLSRATLARSAATSFLSQEAAGSTGKVAHPQASTVSATNPVGDRDASGGVTAVGGSLQTLAEVSGRLERTGRTVGTGTTTRDGTHRTGGNKNDVAGVDKEGEEEVITGPAAEFLRKLSRKDEPVMQDLNRLLQSTEFVEGVEGILENTFFNLISEACSNEFNLAVPPRRVLQTGRK
eukprot:Rmarinus@m.24524